MTRYYGARRALLRSFSDSGLYSFTSFTFSPATLTGRYGPTLANCISYYDTVTNSWLLNSNYFNVTTTGYQRWTVPATGNYRFVISGSRGGQVAGQAYASGSGINIQASLTLTLGDVIIIICGQCEDSANTGFVTSYNGLGGGGGTFVYNSTTATLLLAAGGGGGASFYSGSGGWPGLTGTTSTNGSGGAPGYTGNGGTISGTGSYTGGAGAGWLTAGYNGDATLTKPFPQTNYYGEGGYTYSQGFYGGDYNYAWGNPSTYASTHGGFGGGGGGDGLICGGAGGGYSGGGLSSVSTYNGQAGGGGSYIVSTATSVATSNGNYEGLGTFNGAAITNLNSYNTTFGSAQVTKL